MDPFRQLLLGLAIGLLVLSSGCATLSTLRQTPESAGQATAGSVTEKRFEMFVLSPKTRKTGRTRVLDVVEITLNIKGA